MNWTQIQKKYPKAFKAFIKWLAYSVEVKIEKSELVVYLPITRTYRFQKREIIDPRHLYDFFDKKGIHPYVRPVRKLKRDLNAPLDGWEPSIYGSWMGEMKKSRSKAEFEAFTKSFEISEEGA